jgi:hypothetical protein
MVTANSIEMTSEHFGGFAAARSCPLGECKGCRAQPLTK